MKLRNIALELRVLSVGAALLKLSPPLMYGLALGLVLVAAIGGRAAASGDAQHGAQLYRACVACHALEPDRNMTGPSLAGVIGRKAGGLASFQRYSPALKASGVVWSNETLDAWLRAPAQFIPKNRMVFAGMPDAKARADLIAFLKAPSEAQAQAGSAPQGGGMGSMMGAASRQFPNLKEMASEHQVRSIAYCSDTYRVTTGDGETAEFWETNLRFKTDSSDRGPARGAPAILPAGMMGDRASVFFATPEEISAFIKQEC